MTLKYHMDQMPWAAVLRKAVGMGYVSHQCGTCGLHIHVNRTAFGVHEKEQEAVIARILFFNGVIFNDDTLRRTYELPEGKIETDSYICVQLIKAAGELTAKSLSSMAEALLGSFTITVLGENGALWFVRGDNPMTLYHYPELGVYVYASTKQIVGRALKRVGFLPESPVEIPLISGDILKLNSNGTSSRSRFDDSNISYDVCYSSWRALSPFEEASYIDELKAVAGAYGYTPQSIDRLLRRGFLPEKIKELLYETCEVV